MTEQDPRKVVFLLGAGFSKAAGAPLLKEVVRNIRQIVGGKIGGGPRPEELEFMSKAIKFVHELEKSAFLMGEDPARRLLDEDYELLLGLAEMVDLFEPLEGESNRSDTLRRAFEVAIHRPLQIMGPKSRAWHLPHTSETSKRYDRKGSAYPSFAWLISQLGECATLLTLNHDCILEWVLNVCGVPYKYGGLDDKRAQKGGSTPEIMKLHGSLNWLSCDDGTVNECNMCYVERSGEGPANVGHIDRVRKPCSACEKENHVPEIVPPGPNKSLPQVLQHVWQSSFDALKNAAGLVIIGCSLPKTDSAIRHLLDLGFGETEWGRRVLVVDVAEDRNKSTAYNFFKNRRVELDYNDADYKNLGGAAGLGFEGSMSAISSFCGELLGRSMEVGKNPVLPLSAPGITNETIEKWNNNLSNVKPEQFIGHPVEYSHKAQEIMQFLREQPVLFETTAYKLMKSNNWQDEEIEEFRKASEYEPPAEFGEDQVLFKPDK